MGQRTVTCSGCGKDFWVTGTLKSAMLKCDCKDPSKRKLSDPEGDAEVERVAELAAKSAARAVERERARKDQAEKEKQEKAEKKELALASAKAAAERRQVAIQIERTKIRGETRGPTIVEEGAVEISL